MVVCCMLGEAGGVELKKLEIQLLKTCKLVEKDITKYHLAPATSTAESFEVLQHE